MEGLDEFERQVEEFMDVDSEAGEYNCLCKDVFACSHFEENNGKVLKFFEDESAYGSGCGGAWDNDYSQAILFIDRFDQKIMVAYVSWNDCSCHRNDSSEWWKDDLEDLPETIDDYLKFAPNRKYDAKYAYKFITELEYIAGVVRIIRDMIGARRFRRESVLFGVPKEVLLIILKELWNSVDEEIEYLD